MPSYRFPELANRGLFSWRGLVKPSAGIGGGESQISGLSNLLVPSRMHGVLRASNSHDLALPTSL